MSRNTTHEKFDAVIVGARCAGAATAAHLSANGAKVLVVDYDKPGTDTMSTHALMRSGVLQLKKLGVLDRIVAAGTPPVARTTFIYAGEEIDVDIKPEHGVDRLYAPRRFLLDSVLADEARARGADVRYQTAFSSPVLDDNGRVRGARFKGPEGEAYEVRADFVIGADGKRSTVARHMGASVLRQAQNTVACVYGYFSGLPDRGFRWHFAPGSGGGIIPTNDGLSCVFVAVQPGVHAAARLAKTATVKALIDAHVPQLAQEFQGAVPVGREVTFSGTPGYFRQSFGPGWALVGDAGYFRDPITAHGISDALRDAEILANAIATDDLAGYQATRDALSGEFFALTDKLAALDGTMEETQKAHFALNRIMKSNVDWLASTSEREPCAA